MLDLMDYLNRQRRFLFAGVFIIVDLILVMVLATVAQNHKVSADTQPKSVVVVVHNYDSPNVLTDGLQMLMDNINQKLGSINQSVFKAADAAAVGAAHSGSAAEYSTHLVAASTSLGFSRGFETLGSVAGDSSIFVGRTIIKDPFMYSVHAILNGFGFLGHAASHTIGFASHVTDVGSVIRPAENIPTPTITKLRAQQATLIQSGTKNVVFAPLITGIGGYCDGGDGNGGYPAAWCNSPIDSIATIPYSGDPVNRECTSYVYWYFTRIEGHTNFRAWGNAKDWANTSNFAISTTPSVGSIAVETVGAYGHVAIVQALAGQKFAGGLVPSGYVLVSEMNYDWNGHFRYSFSPLSKFSAYIY
jgi:CHAP domain